MTLSDISALVEEWQEPLGLTTWDLTVELVANPGDEDNTLAACLPSGHYEQATLQFAEALLQHPPLRVESVVVHELLHLTFRDLSSVLQDAEEQLGPVAGPMFHNRTLHDFEALIDKLDTILVVFC
jgi:alkylhydroperoxidase family enzyme